MLSPPYLHEATLLVPPHCPGGLCSSYSLPCMQHVPVRIQVRATAYRATAYRVVFAMWAVVSVGSQGGQATAERGGAAYSKSNRQPTKSSIDGQKHKLYHTKCGHMIITTINLYSGEGWPTSHCTHCKREYSVRRYTKEGLEPRWDKASKTLSWVRVGQSKGTKCQKLA